MSVVRSVLFWVLFGALTGTWAGGLIGRSWVPWFNTPGGGVQSQCACGPITHETVTHMITFELWGMIAGAVLALVLALVFGAGRKRKVEPAGPAAPPPAAA